MSSPKAEGSILCTISENIEVVFEVNKLEIDSNGWTYYRPEPGTVYNVYRNVEGQISLNLSKYQHERFNTDLCETPLRDVYEEYMKRGIGV